MTAPATIIVVHPRERRAKCTVHPLRKRPGFVFYKHPRFPTELTGYVRLGLGGPVLGPADVDCGLLVLDGTWRWVEPMERLATNLPVRSLPLLTTAYPRSSKVSDNPDGGLATVEAIYAACRLLGRDTTGLLDHYRWGQQFVEQNQNWWPVNERGSADHQCSNCKNRFVCEIEQGRDRCWCMDLPPVLPAEPGASCVCPDCLSRQVHETLSIW